MRVSLFGALFCLVVSSGKGRPTEVAPQVIYGTYLGGRHKECATAIAVDGNSNAYVVGRTPLFLIAEAGGRREHLGDARFAVLECVSEAVLQLLLVPVSDDGVRIGIAGRTGELRELRDVLTKKVTCVTVRT
jgi:hypothetical protein